MSNELTILEATAPLTVDGMDVSTHPAVIYLAGLQSDNSRATMRRQLDAVAKLLGSAGWLACPWPALRVQHITTLRAELARRYSPATANLMLAAVRGVLRAARQLGQISADDYSNAISIKRVAGNAPDAATGRALAQTELNRLMQTCAADPSQAGARDAAIIALAYALGLRRAEIVGLDMGDVQAEQRGYRVSIRGKGNKLRVAYLVGSFAAALADWLAVRGAQAGPLFVRLKAGERGGDPSGRMTTQAVYNLMLARAAQAGIEAFSPHDMRRTCISNHIDAGTDLVTVAAIVGHSSVQTTARYDRRGERAKQAAADNLHLAYTPRKRG